MRVILCNKPYDVLCQFTDRDAGRRTLADFIPEPGVYPAGRLDRDSEGLVLLTDHGPLQARLSKPGGPWAKTYWAQVDGDPTAADIDQLTTGVTLKDGPARALDAALLPADWPEPWSRTPPIRVRKAIPTRWITLQLNEGRNRQVRRMCAAIGFPCLRLIRSAIGPLTITDLPPGQWRWVDPTEVPRVSPSRPRQDPLAFRNRSSDHASPSRRNRVPRHPNRPSRPQKRSAPS